MDDFLKELNFSVSICDAEGSICYLNNKGEETFAKEGGKELLGTNILDCHPEPSKSKLKEMMITHETQAYFKGEGDRKRLIYQTPVYKEGNYAGYFEMIIPLAGLV